MTVASLARRAGGLTYRTVRFYEEKGLIRPCATAAGGRRRYDEDALLALKRINLLKKAGMPLEEIRRTLRWLKMAGNARKARQQAHARVLKEARKNLLSYARELSGLLGAIDDALANEGRCDNCNAGDCSGCKVLDKWMRFGY